MWPLLGYRPSRATARATRASAIDSNPAFASSGLKGFLLENRPAILRFLSARRVSAGEAEDLVQELFVKLETHPTGPVTDMRAYLFRMADNLLLDHRRSAGRRTSREEAWMDAHFGSEADDRPTAEQMTIARQNLEIVSQALAQLPARTVDVFRRFRVDAIPQKQIAADLGISVSAIEKHLQKAYHVLVEVRARLDADAPPPHRP